VDTIRAATEHMGVLIEELLEYARLGRGQVRTEPVPLEPILERLGTTFADRIAAAGGSLEISRPLAVPAGDPLLLEQILANLIDNALTYRRDDVTPLVTIAAVRDGERVTITVADNGIGIAPDQREKIFEVFTRLHGDDEYEGTGIGLSIVRKAARLMGSDITVTSAVGVGSTFAIELPAAAEEGTDP
jgi:signal transduction histidine kinase